MVVVVHSTLTTCQWTFTSPNTSPTMQGELTINKSRGGKSKSECKTCCQMQLCFGLSDLHSDAEVMGGFSVIVIHNFFFCEVIKIVIIFCFN